MPSASPSTASCSDTPRCTVHHLPMLSFSLWMTWGGVIWDATATKSSNLHTSISLPRKGSVSPSAIRPVESAHHPAHQFSQDALLIETASGAGSREAIPATFEKVKSPSRNFCEKKATTPAMLANGTSTDISTAPNSPSRTTMDTTTGWPPRITQRPATKTPKTLFSTGNRWGYSRDTPRRLSLKREYAG